jgi:hypothetical protein
MPVENRQNFDKGTPDEIVTNKAKVKAKNEPVIGTETTESNMPNGDAPTGDATDSVLGKK